MYTFSKHELELLKTHLIQVDTPPQQLFIESKHCKQEVVHILQTPSVAIVGTRRPTSYGIFATQKIATEICEITMGMVPIVSGFMYGIDQIAHQATYKEGGKIIAVLAHGFDHIPRRYKRFAEQILQAGGIFVSEYPPEVPPQKFMFIARNRIVAALSQVILVPEAAIVSGSMHTVKFGLGIGLEIAAVPGLITNPYAEGTKWLVNQGATFVSSGQEVLELTQDLQDILHRGAHFNSSDASDAVVLGTQKDSKSPLALQILKQLKAHPKTVNELSELLAVSLLKVSSELSNLELQGLILQANGEWVLQYSP